jgi:hypothetical protein
MSNLPPEICSTLRKRHNERIVELLAELAALDGQMAVIHKRQLEKARHDAFNELASDAFLNVVFDLLARIFKLKPLQVELLVKSLEPERIADDLTQEEVILKGEKQEIRDKIRELTMSLQFLCGRPQPILPRPAVQGPIIRPRH